MKKDKTLEEKYGLYTASGFKALQCKGWHKQYNPKTDYKTAKEAVTKGFTGQEYRGLSLVECEEWIEQGGWICWTIPKGIIALDIEDDDTVAYIISLCKKQGIPPGIHKTKNGWHIFFSCTNDISADSNAIMKMGAKVTYRVGGKNYLILSPTEDRYWEQWLPVQELPKLPEEFYPYNKSDKSEVIRALSWNLGDSRKTGLLHGYDDIDTSYMVYLIEHDFKLNDVQDMYQLLFRQEYDSRRTEAMYNRTVERLNNGSQVRGSGSLIQKLKELKLEKALFLVNQLAPERTIVETDSVKKWPDPPSPEAYYGLAGEFVRLIEPHTEADSVALLIQFLVMSGNIIGKSAHFIAEADIHYLNLFTVLVGHTSKGRKGSSWGRSKTTFEGIDDNWGKNCIKTGLSSGEGLIWAIRDPIYKHETVKDKGKPTGEVMEIEIDHGVEDKRLLVFEPEFASTLRAMNRDGNTLSAIIRQAWDTGDLKTLTKNSPAKATGGHISIVGHITKDELRRYLDRTESGNGFANRILWVCVQRSKTLPEGGNLKESDLASFNDLLSDAMNFARKTGMIKRDDEARAIWREVYPELSEGKPGLLGAVTSRAEAQVMRLACLYAVLDFSYFVRPEHLKAALAVWEYCEASCQYIFGDSLGDPVADEILRELRKSPEGLTGTDINNLFGRNKNANQLSQALSLLMDNGLVKRGLKETNEGGRPPVLWTAI